MRGCAIMQRLHRRAEFPVQIPAPDRENAWLSSGLRLTPVASHQSVPHAWIKRGRRLRPLSARVRLPGLSPLTMRTLLTSLARGQQFQHHRLDRQASAISIAINSAAPTSGMNVASGFVFGSAL